MEKSDKKTCLKSDFFPNGQTFYWPCNEDFVFTSANIDAVIDSTAEVDVVILVAVVQLTQIEGVPEDRILYLRNK